MNFDDFKNNWKSEQDEIEIQFSKSSNHPLRRLQKTLYREIIAQIVGVIFLAFFPFLFSFSEILTKVYFIVYAMIFVSACYYILSFRKFYQSLNVLHYSSYQGLYEVYVRLQIFIERYKSFSLFIVPYALLALLISFLDNYYDQELHQFIVSQNKLITIIVILTFTTILFLLLINIYCRIVYGRYVKELKKLIDEFDNN
ncbi:hypothetical protein MUB18_20635 [Sphingobacterium sp. PCS056]|uniref:hypothetical protein n=1 Tax=Sphingobacterium sp. PCS056 TaxID=2931400 RepID=UPI00200CA865|nr:hypothetical protein [Sphingobacterium sp. PCS056]UPZ36496.1 hypothetical protein MUB18_20635 [Sphingobacterium sp. PCS056]